MKSRYLKITSFKAILFYGVTLLSVIALFSITTTYGETHLKASTKIAGTYVISNVVRNDVITPHLNSNQNTDCLKDILFRLDQSGQYLTAELILPKMPIANSDRSTFSGTWSGRPEADGKAMIKLAGRLADGLKCDRNGSGKSWIQGDIVNETFSGNLIMETGDRISFMAKAIARN